MHETLENTVDVVDLLGMRLRYELGAQVFTYYRIPGFENGVEKDGVEISVSNGGSEGIKVFIAIPISIRDDRTFQKVEYRFQGKAIRFMLCKEKININSPDELEEKWSRITEIIKYGASLIHYHPDKISPDVFFTKQVEEKINRPLKGQEKIRQAGTIGSMIGLAIGLTMGWENTKELTDYLVQQGIFDISKAVQEVLNNLAAAQRDADNIAQEVFFRAWLAAPLAAITAALGSVVAAVKEVMRKPKT